MQRTVARLNIEHYKQLLAAETGEEKRQTFKYLLAEAEAKLQTLPEKANSKKGSA